MIVVRQVKQLIYEVRKAMDEAGFNDAQFVSSDKDSSELDIIIESKLEEALKYILLIAPYKYLEGTYIEGTTNIGYVQGQILPYTAYSIDAPHDFLRFIKMEVNQWKKIVTEVHLEGSPMDARQNDPYVMGTPEEPVVIMRISNRNETSSVKFSLYSVVPITATAYLHYVPIPKIVRQNKDNNIATLEVIDMLEPAFIQYTAGLTKSTLRDETAQVHFETATAFLT